MIATILIGVPAFYAGVYSSDKLNLKFDTIASPFVKGYKFIQQSFEEEKKAKAEDIEVTSKQN